MKITLMYTGTRAEMYKIMICKYIRYLSGMWLRKAKELADGLQDGLSVTIDTDAYHMHQFWRDQQYSITRLNEKVFDPHGEVLHVLKYMKAELKVTSETVTEATQYDNEFEIWWRDNTGPDDGVAKPIAKKAWKAAIENI